MEILYLCCKPPAVLLSRSGWRKVSSQCNNNQNFKHRHSCQVMNFVSAHWILILYVINFQLMQFKINEDLFSYIKTATSECHSWFNVRVLPTSWNFPWQGSTQPGTEPAEARSICIWNITVLSFMWLALAICKGAMPTCINMDKANSPLACFWLTTKWTFYKLPGQQSQESNQHV